jgi:hypothetical protein
MIDPGFDAEAFLHTECYRDSAMIDRLRRDLTAAVAMRPRPPAGVVALRGRGPDKRPGRDAISSP